MVNCVLVDAQFTYFNQITGDLEDENSESVANVEAVSDGYVVWGGGVDSTGQLFHFVRKYGMEGTVIDENVLIHEDQYVLSGIVSTFKWNPYTQTFVYIHGTSLPGGITEGYLIEFDQDLDTNFTRRYDQYPPYTYPFIFEVESDGYIVVGEHGGMDNSAGTFIMKLTFNGDTLWSEIMQPEVYQHIYRNWDVLRMDNGYFISGGGVIDGESFGLLTITDITGHTLSEIEILDEDEMDTNAGGAVRTSNDEIWLCRSIGYADVEEFEDPEVLWNKIRVEKFDVASEEIYWSQDYHDDFEFILGGTRKMLATPHGGVIILGGRFGFNFDVYAWIMKLDSLGNEEWFHEYTYQNCENCFNTLQDIEHAPDGGYIAAGYFANYDIDPRNATWLLKVDACGDVEWQGCEPLGLAEQEAKQFKVYPNPSRGRFTVETESQTRVASWQVYDLLGRQVAQSTIQVGRQFSVDVNLPSGLYTLHLFSKNGRLKETHRIELAK